MHGRHSRVRSVIPAKAGIHFSCWNKILAWVPAFAGTTLRPAFHTLMSGREGGFSEPEIAMIWYNITFVDLTNPSPLRVNRWAWGQKLLLRLRFS